MAFLQRKTCPTGYNKTFLIVAGTVENRVKIKALANESVLGAFCVF